MYIYKDKSSIVCLIHVMEAMLTFLVFGCKSGENKFNKLSLKSSCKL